MAWIAENNFVLPPLQILQISVWALSFIIVGNGTWLNNLTTTYTKGRNCVQLSWVARTGSTTLNTKYVIALVAIAKISNKQ